MNNLRSKKRRSGWTHARVIYLANKSSFHVRKDLKFSFLLVEGVNKKGSMVFFLNNIFVNSRQVENYSVVARYLVTFRHIYNLGVKSFTQPENFANWQCPNVRPAVMYLKIFTFKF